MYKITFNMTSPICYIDMPLFDAIIAYCVYCKERKISDFHTPVGGEVIDFELPLARHPAGFYLASYMIADRSEEGIDAWKKRWESKYDYLADFGNARRRINTASGRYKSYDIPLVIHSCLRASFYFDGAADKIGDMISEYLPAFGKKTAIGFGFYSSFEIEECSNEKMLYFRPLPALLSIVEKAMSFKPIRLERKRGAWKPPYWLVKNWDDIVIPYFGKEGSSVNSN